MINETDKQFNFFLKTLITNGTFLWRGIIDKANVLAVHYERVEAA